MSLDDRVGGDSAAHDEWWRAMRAGQPWQIKTLGVGVLGVVAGEVPKRLNGADCKSAGYAFGGSNPPLSTIRRLEGESKRERGNSSVG